MSIAVGMVIVGFRHVTEQIGVVSTCGKDVRSDAFGLRVLLAGWSTPSGSDTIPSSTISVNFWIPSEMTLCWTNASTSLLGADLDEGVLGVLDEVDHRFGAFSSISRNFRSYSSILGSHSSSKSCSQ
jgi:hypothetical protein